MIKNKLVFSIVCDHCGKDFCEGAEEVGWSDIGFVEQMAQEQGWVVLSGWKASRPKDDTHFHYCPDHIPGATGM